MVNKYSSHHPAKENSNFENYIAIDVNYRAKKTAIDFVNSNTDTNVLVISSSVGNGSTHLAFSIINETEKIFNQKEAFYIGFEKLSIDFNKNDKKAVLDVDYLNTKSIILIDSYHDDVYLKNDSDELFYILKNVTTKIIITCTEGNQIPIKHENIILKTPSFVEKKIIIENLLKCEEFYLPQNIINHIAEDSLCSVRRLQGLIISIIVQNKHYHQVVDLQLIHNILKKINGV